MNIRRVPYLPMNPADVQPPKMVNNSALKSSRPFAVGSTRNQLAKQRGKQHHANRKLEATFPLYLKQKKWRSFLLLIFMSLLLLLLILIVCFRPTQLVHLSYSKDVAPSNNKKTSSASKLLFDPTHEFSAEEWLKIQQSTVFARKTNIKQRRRILLTWPTIPVALKGSDTRAIDTIEFLSTLGYHVDLLVWTEYASESLDPSYDNAQDIERIRAAGVHRILGPFDVQDFASAMPPEFFEPYIAMIL